MNCLIFLILVKVNRYSDRFHDFSVTISRCYKSVYVNSFFPRTAIGTNHGLFNWCHSITFYHGILYGLLGLTREKFHLIEAFIVSNNTTIFCISETFLDSSADGIYDELNISDYTSVQIDDPNTKCICVTIYYKYHLPVIRSDDIFSLKESVVLKIRLVSAFFPTFMDHPDKTRINLMNFVQL